MSRRALGLLLAICLAASAVHSQLLTEEAWQEAEAPPPPAFSTERLLRFEVNPQSTMVYGVDPQTIQISPVDRVVRYVVVASSPEGARNVLYEGIRCPTGQVKTYARHNGQAWVMFTDPQWLPMALRPSRHALQLARQGACDNAGTPSNAQDVVRALRQTSAQPLR